MKNSTLLIISFASYFLLIFLLTLRHFKEKRHQKSFKSISGEDVIATQMDLARAYLEAGKKQLARTLLKTVRKQGSFIQKQEAKKLLATL